MKQKKRQSKRKNDGGGITELESREDRGKGKREKRKGEREEMWREEKRRE